MINIQEKAIRNAGLVMSNNRETANKEKKPKQNKDREGRRDVVYTAKYEKKGNSRAGGR